jgi:2-succinyl-5-enolpyruvyl-6-hydroxy-3-cyclohexene-1-carboxylate synthase
MTATDSYLLLRALVDEFARCGMEHACTSPGSRNTPIVLSLVRDGRLRCWSHVDERSAGFFALGAAKASGRPVAVTCTSGTAAANLMPAVIEAREAGVPLIVLTADRPAELRQIGAGQTIDQVKLYGDAVKWFFELGVPEAGQNRLRWIRTLACRAYWTALDGRPGPVHLNLPLREPLVLEEPLPEDATGRTGGQPFVMVERRGEPGPAQGPGPHPSGRVLVVAGAGTDDPAGLAGFCAEAGIPLLADPLSGARSGAAAIAHYDLLLRDGAFAEAHRPDFVFRLGELPTSKPLRGWLGDLADVAQVAVDPQWAWQDPGSVVGMRLRGSLPRPDHLQVEGGWLSAWRVADAAVAEAIAVPLAESGLSEPVVAAMLGRLLASEATLFVASSMPIRDVEEFVVTRPDPPRVLSNRGANGIDGTVSSALGVAAVSRGPVVLLTGDVALAHDIGGLLTVRRGGPPLTIVLLNNGGGGIFHFLPVVSQRDAFEGHIGTPTGLDFSLAAELYGCDYERPGDAGAFEASISRSLAGRGTTILEVRTDRDANRELHRAVEAAALSALSAVSQPVRAAAPGV